MKDQLSRLEQRIEHLIEGSLARWFGARMSAAAVAAQLARAMEDGLKWDEERKAYAPDQFALTLHPADADQLLEQEPDVHARLASALLEAAREGEVILAREPHITLAADPTLSRSELRVIAWHSSNPLEFTQAMPSGQQAAPGSPSGAFLIIDGQRHFALDHHLINIGRRLDNQLILDDAHVSRTHAQLRVRDGRYVLFDLGSTSGTKVNGRAIKQHILRPGDVITIARTRMVYGEDPGGPPDATPVYTPPFPPRPQGDQRTRAGDWEDDTE
jgi:hypothetical protein